MATTIKLKKPAGPRPDRPPVRGAGSAPRARPTLAQAQAERARRPPTPEAPSRAPQPAHKPAHKPAQKPAHKPASQPGRPAGPAARPAPPGARPPAARPPAAQATPPAPHTDGSLRLSKRMSELGLASRREADEWIAKGWVRVDGEVVAELGARVLPQQRITVEAKARHEQAQRVTVLLNKPVGYVSGQAEDGYEPAVVLVQAKTQWREDRSGVHFTPAHLKHLAPAGRLDIDSVGLLVLTQDGRIAKQLVGEDGQLEKEYLVRVEPLVPGQRLSDEGLALLNHGLVLDEQTLKPARVEWINEDQLRFVLTEGRKRQIRRMCEAVGLKVTGLKRVRIGRVTLGDLPAGQWRYLRPDESFV